MVSYTYDAWGKPISMSGTLASTLGTIQPFRYRGYVYDDECEFFYLRSRFYCPTLCRFVNADALQNLIGAQVERNLFAYAMNTPVFRIDPNGYSSEDMSLWGGIMDVLGSIHISGGIGFGLRMEGEMMVGNVPINLALGEKIDILAADWGDGEIVIGGGMARGIDLGIKEFLSIGGGSSVFHPYTETEQCTCKSLTFEDMLDCPAANTSSGLSGEVGIGVEAYLGIGGNLGASIDLVQIDRGLKKILNSIADFWDNLF